MQTLGDVLKSSSSGGTRLASAPSKAAVLDHGVCVQSIIIVFLGFIGCIYVGMDTLDTPGPVCVDGRTRALRALATVLVPAVFVGITEALCRVPHSQPVAAWAVIFAFPAVWLVWVLLVLPAMIPPQSDDDDGDEHK